MAGAPVPPIPNPDSFDFDQIEHRVRSRFHLPEGKRFKSNNIHGSDNTNNVNDNNSDTDNLSDDNIEDEDNNTDEEYNDEEIESVVFESKGADTCVSIFTKEEFDLHIKRKRLSIRATLEEATLLKKRGLLSKDVKVSYYLNRSETLKTLYTRDSSGWWYAASVENLRRDEDLLRCHGMASFYLSEPSKSEGFLARQHFCQQATCRDWLQQCFKKRSRKLGEHSQAGQL